MSSLIKEYNTTSELQDDIDAKIKDVEQRITEYSKKIGGKLREDKELENDDPNVQQIKESTTSLCKECSERTITCYASL